MVVKGPDGIDYNQESRLTNQMRAVDGVWKAVVVSLVMPIWPEAFQEVRLIDQRLMVDVGWMAKDGEPTKRGQVVGRQARLNNSREGQQAWRSCFPPRCVQGKLPQVSC